MRQRLLKDVTIRLVRLVWPYRRSRELDTRRAAFPRAAKTLGVFQKQGPPKTTETFEDRTKAYKGFEDNFLISVTKT